MGYVMFQGLFIVNLSTSEGPGAAPPQMLHFAQHDSGSLKTRDIPTWMSIGCENEKTLSEIRLRLTNFMQVFRVAYVNFASLIILLQPGRGFT